MWFLTKSILEYLSNDRIPLSKREEVSNKNKDRIVREIKKLDALEFVKYLFNSKVPKSTRIMICDYVNELSLKKDQSSIIFVNRLIVEFKGLNINKTRYISSDTCPDAFKRVIIENLYGNNLVEVVIIGKVSKDVKKQIIKLCLTIFDIIKVLSNDVSMDIKNFIIDDCLVEDYDIRKVLDDRNIPLDIKERIICSKVNMSNLYKVMYLSSSGTDELLFKIKEKDIENYVNSLTYKHILSVVNDYDTPRKMVEYIISHRGDILGKAIDNASISDIENTVYRERSSLLFEMALKRRSKTIYGILLRLWDFEALRWLNIKDLPKEYKDFIVKKYKRKFNSYFDRISVLDAKDYLKNDSSLPQDIQDMLLSRTKQKILDYLSNENDIDIISTIRHSNFIPKLKAIIIEERINKGNLFYLLSERYLDQETLEMTLEIKKDLLAEMLRKFSNDKLFKFDTVGFDDNILERILSSNLEIIKERVKLLNQDELLNYLNNGKVKKVVKRIILEELGIDYIDVNNVLGLMEIYDSEIILNSYNDIKIFLESLNIDFNSFLQYGSGSKKYSNWLDSIFKVIENDEIAVFTKCKDYFFDNYYELKSENAVDTISSFLEFLNSYSIYKELYLSIVNGDIVLSQDDKLNLTFLLNINYMKKEYIPKDLGELSTFKTKLYNNYIKRINSDNLSVYEMQKIFNNVLFCKAQDILWNIGGTGALRTLKKDNASSPSVCELIDELMLYSSIIEMVNDTNNVEGLRIVLIYIFSDINLLTKIQNSFATFERKVVTLYELDSKNNLTSIEEAREIGDMIDVDLSKKYGGEVFDYSCRNYCLYAHILSSKENIEDVVSGVSSGNSNFISVSPVSYRGQKYYWDRDNVIVAFDRIPFGSFICSSISNMSTNYKINSNSLEVGEISRIQRGILETSAVVDRNAEALLYREGLKPCGLILPGGRTPTKKELEIHQKYNLPFIVTQELHKSINDPIYDFINDLSIDIKPTSVRELKEIIKILRPNVVIKKEDDVYTGREIALFTDCHSMYEPTLAILEDIRRSGINEIYSLGDNVGLGPNPTEVFDLLEEYGVKSIAGNAEYYNTIGIDAFPYLVDSRLDNQLWTERKLGTARIKKLKLYPASIDLIVGNKKFGLCHFANDVRWDFRERSVHSYYGGYIHSNSSKQFLYTNSEEAIEKVTNCIVSNKPNVSVIKGYIDAKENPIFDGKLVTDYDCIIQGHVHFDIEDTLCDTDIITLRAVGMGYEKSENENEACYYVIRERKDGDVELEKRYVEFNKNALLSSIYTCDLPSKDRVLSYVKKSR